MAGLLQGQGHQTRPHLKGRIHVYNVWYHLWFSWY